MSSSLSLVDPCPDAMKKKKKLEGEERYTLAQRGFFQIREVENES